MSTIRNEKPETGTIIGSIKIRSTKQKSVPAIPGKSKKS